MEKYRKAVTATVGAAVAVLGVLGVPVAGGLPEAVVALITAALVYVIPND